MSTIEFYIF